MMKNTWKFAATLLATTTLGFLAAHEANASVTADFTDDGTITVPTFKDDGITVSGSNDIQLSTSFGLGIFGGINPVTVDPGETISFDFDAAVSPVTDVMITDFTTNDTDLNDDLALNGTFSAFDGGSNLLFTNTVNIDHTNPAINVSGILNDTPFQRFDLTMNNDGLAIGEVRYNPVPEPGSLVLFAAGAGLVMTRLGRRPQNNAPQNDAPSP